MSSCLTAWISGVDGAVPEASSATSDGVRSAQHSFSLRQDFEPPRVHGRRDELAGVVHVVGHGHEPHDDHPVEHRRGLHRCPHCLRPRGLLRGCLRGRLRSGRRLRLSYSHCHQRPSHLLSLQLRYQGESPSPFINPEQRNVYGVKFSFREI